MVDIKRQIVALLIAEDVSDSEFRAISAWLRSGGIGECVHAADQIRQVLRGSAPPRVAVAPARAVRNGGTASPVADVPTKVYGLLITEAGIGTQEAQRLLVRRLGYQRPLPPKKGFKTIVQRLVSDVGGSSVLSAAHQIRNERLHTGARPEWGLAGVESDD